MSTFAPAPLNSTITVVFGVRADAQLTGDIRNVDPRIEVRHAAGLDPAARGRLLGEAHVIFGIPAGTRSQLEELLRTNAGLRWVHARTQEELERVRGAKLTGETRVRLQITGPGRTQAGALAEFAMLGLLSFARESHRAKPGSGTPSRTEGPVSELAGQTLLVVGLGSVGAEVARLGNAFGMKVVAMTRTGNGHAPHVDELRPARFLGDMLQVSHAVVLALPQNEQTAGLIGSGRYAK